MTDSQQSKRADIFLVEHGYAESRAEAQAAIRAGCVTADDVTVTKPAQLLREGMRIVFEKAHPYVSRGALKLIAALDRFGLSPEDRICLDIGASTGGFTQVLLERGAKRVYAIDVGHGQLHGKIASDPRVVSLEHLNARDLTHAHIVGRADAIVADVSFISLKLALPPALALASSGAWLIVLVKPQFETGRDKIGKGGIVKDKAAQQAALDGIVHWLSMQHGWRVLGTMESPIPGGDGSREFLLAASRT